MTKILVIPTSKFTDLIEYGDATNLNVIRNLINTYGLYIEREDAEKDPTYLQIIPYTVCKKGTDIFAYTRLKKGAESRLHSKMSIGVGGHVDKLNGYQTNWDTTQTTIINELYEELNIEATTEFIHPTYTGIVIYDPSNDVGKVHLGIVYQVQLDNREVTVRETEKLEGKFYTHSEIEALSKDDNCFENWSKIVIEAILKGTCNV